MDLSGLRIPLSGLGGEIKRVAGFIPVAALTELARDGVVEEAASAEFTVWRGEEKRFRVKGWVQGRVRLSCARCLNDFSVVLAGEVDRDFKIGRDPAQLDRELEVMDDVVYLEDGMLSLRSLVAEELVLLLPMVPLCKEGCRGLCPGCGVDLNQEPCHCGESPPQGPFAALLPLLAGDLAGDKEK